MDELSAKSSSVKGSNPDDLLLRFLSDRDVPCPQCGYNLRSLSGDKCPECGEKITLCLGLVEPRQAAPIAGLIGLASGAGFNGLLLIFGLIKLAPRRSGYNEFIEFIGINAAGLIILGSMIVWWLLRWRWIRVRPAIQRWSLACFCWILAVVDLAVFTTYIR